jgi:hypothetical protein
MSTIPVRPLICLLKRGAGLPALQVVVEVTAGPDGARLLLNGAVLAYWSALVAQGVARLSVGDQTGLEGVAVRVVALDTGGLASVLMGGRFLFSLELGLDGGLLAACVGRPDAVLRPAIA